MQLNTTWYLEEKHETYTVGVVHISRNAVNTHLNILHNRTHTQVRYRQHINAIRNNRQNSKFTQHILETGHEYITLDQTVEILHIDKKEPKLNTLERSHIYDITKKGL
jgi:hypothetical protein